MEQLKVKYNIMFMLSPRLMRKLDRKTKRILIKDMQLNMSRLIKPRPFFIPRFFWIRLICFLLDIDKKQIK